jgi:hypothetical protein
MAAGVDDISGCLGHRGNSAKSERPNKAKKKNFTCNCVGVYCRIGSEKLISF